MPARGRGMDERLAPADSKLVTASYLEQAKADGAPYAIIHFHMYNCVISQVLTQVESKVFRREKMGPR